MGYNARLIGPITGPKRKQGDLQDEQNTESDCFRNPFRLGDVLGGLFAIDTYVTRRRSE